MQFSCLWEGATASNADIRRNLIETCCDSYIKKNVDGIFFSPLERVPDADRINETICNKIQQEGIPLILIDRDIVPIPQKSPFIAQIQPIPSVFVFSQLKIRYRNKD